MPSIYSIKPAFQRLLRPLCAALHGAGVTPNQITAATLLAAFGMGAWMYVGMPARLPFLILPVFLFVRMAANAVDGMMAREYALCSPTGAVLNEVGDVLADAVLYLPFALLPCVHPVLPVAVVILAGATEVAGLAAVSGGVGRRFDGPMGKSDRAFAFGLLGLLYGVGIRNTLAWDLLLGLVMALLLVTLYNRFRNGTKGQT
jgi:CDP-diacylglycerol--glycerol-3-phosphate 3-phosphatidyltransferase